MNKNELPEMYVTVIALLVFPDAPPVPLIRERRPTSSLRFSFLISLK